MEKHRQFFGSRIHYRVGRTGKVEFATGFRPAFLIAHWRMSDGRTFYDQRAPFRLRESQRAYHQLLKSYYSFLVPPACVSSNWAAAWATSWPPPNPRGASVSISARR